MRGLRKWLGTAPETRDELLKLVQNSRRFLEPDTVAMLEGVLDLPATKIREVMTPRTAMISMQEDDQLLDILHVLVESAHSRFPVFSADQPDNVVGILLAKDLLPFLTEPNTKLDIGSLMRQPLFVPESARSDQVLRIVPDNDHTVANAWMVQALTPIEHFNTVLDADFSDDEVETVGGLLLQEIGLVSDLQGQTVELGKWLFTIVEADARTIHLIRAVRQ